MELMGEELLNNISQKFLEGTLVGKSEAATEGFRTKLGILVSWNVGVCSLARCSALLFKMFYWFKVDDKASSLKWGKGPP